ncbi:MAG: hypothetical protein GF344_12015, partial [Chitinivibrionales bacterium]|nr:hypothetical protein [Chitinivibrionales bacterium]MBD3357503.1 hypothetical protein [Chitinivibrionales bacterium]
HMESLPVIRWNDASIRYLSIAPDGENIVFSANAGSHWHVYVADTAGGTPIQITDARGNHIDARVSPDGRRLAYLSDRGGLTDQYDLWVHDREVGSHERFTFTSDVEQYCWYADGRTLIVSAGDPPRLQKIDISLGRPLPLTKSDGGEEYGEHSPRLYRFEGKTRIMYVRSYRSGKKHVRRIAVDGSDDRRITRSGGSEWLE